MSVNITTHFIDTFKQGIEHLVQQKGSVLRNAVQVETGVRGKRRAIDQLSETTVQQRTVRHGDLEPANMIHKRRWVTLTDFEWMDFIDQPDKLRVLNDPTNAYSQAAAMAMGRAMDSVIATAYDADVATGVDGTSTQSFDPNFSFNSAGTGGNNHLSTADVIKARRLLIGADNDPNEEYIAVVTAAQLEDMLNDTLANDADHNTVRALVNGEVNTWVGFRWVIYNGLPTDDNGLRKCFFYRRRAVELDIGADIAADIDVRKDKSGLPTQVYYSMTIGAVRLQEKSVVRVLVSEA